MAAHGFHLPAVQQANQSPVPDAVLASAGLLALGFQKGLSPSWQADIAACIALLIFAACIGLPWYKPGPGRNTWASRINWHVSMTGSFLALAALLNESILLRDEGLPA